MKLGKFLITIGTLNILVYLGGVILFHRTLWIALGEASMMVLISTPLLYFGIRRVRKANGRG